MKNGGNSTLVGSLKLSDFELTEKKYILKLLIKKEEVYFKTAKENFTLAGVYQAVVANSKVLIR